ncbi:MAG: SDR family oxidoreductase [Chloroflexi bacterium]|nr:SDR family oxidoreductase [Chloroflexota bacterium]
MAGILAGKVAVITGAGRGIGRGIALAMAQAGARVVVNDYGVQVNGTEPQSGPADQVVAEIVGAGGTAVANYDSVATMEGGERIIQTALDRFGGIDILVNNAGILRDRMIFNMTEAEWDAVIAVHLKGTFNCTRHASILMRQQKSGRIINITSTSGLVGNTGQANYGAAKAGIMGFTLVVARDLGAYGVTCNAIAPGAQTRMTESVPDRARQMRAMRALAGRPARGGFLAEMRGPEYVAPLAVWLASDQAKDINGQVFGVSGGLIQLYALPAPIKTIFKEGLWTVEELLVVMPATLTPGLINPAPPVSS